MASAVGRQPAAARLAAVAAAGYLPTATNGCQSSYTTPGDTTIELGVDDERRCPHCGAGGAVSRGKARGLRRFWCKDCGKTFGALTGTALSGLHHKERWLAFGASLGAGETIKESAERCGIAPSTAHRWRHRFLAAVRQAPDRLAGIVEADETFVLESREGEWKLDRKPRRRGGKARKRGLSREQVPIVVRRAIVTPHNRMESVGYRTDRRQNLALNNNPDGVCGRRDCNRADSVITVQ